MNKKLPLVLASMFLVVACGSNNKNTSEESKFDNSSSLVNDSSNNEESSISSTNSYSSSESKVESSSKPNSSTSNKTSSTSKPNSSTSKPTSSTSKDNGSINEPGSTITDPITGEVIDLNGYIEVYQAPEGVVLTDWTDEMRGIFTKYLYFQVPPFIWLEGLTVSYDNMGILQVKGKYTEAGVAAKYADTLMKAGYMAYTTDEGNIKRCYGRGIGNGFLISVDGLEAKNDLFSINFDYEVAETSWPAQALAEELNTEIYGYTKTVVPPYTYDNPQYYVSGNGFGEVDILCIGAPKTCVSDYSAILEANHWTVAPYGDEGMYTAISRDKRVVLIYYFDGTGLQIAIGFGEGESSKTWEDCIPAINDFGRTELRLTRDIADEIPAISTAELYEIDRSVRGALEITAYRTISYKTEDIFNYATEAAAEGVFEFKVKGEYYWLAAKDKSYAIRLELKDYVDDTLATTTIVLTICDYTIYEGGYVYYGAWPTAQVRTIAYNINPEAVVPGYVNEDATYYVFSDYNYTINIKIVNPGANALAEYKAILEDYSYTVKTLSEISYEAIDRTETVKITVKLEDGMLKIDITKYIKQVVNNGTAKFNFKNELQISSKTGYTSATWTVGNVTFKVEKGNAVYSVGNEGDYLANPLRIYKNQKVTISCSDASITKLDFYATNSNGTRAITNFDVNFLKNLNITGATLETYNAQTGLIRFVVNPGASEISFVATTTNSNNNSGFGLVSLDVVYA